MEELLTTEREYVIALGYVREHYFPELERADVPQDLRGQRGIIFGNLEKLHDFHQHHFLSELEGCVNEPLRVGRCFLRHVGETQQVKKLRFACSGECRHSAVRCADESLKMNESC